MRMLLFVCDLDSSRIRPGVTAGLTAQHQLTSIKMQDGKPLASTSGYPRTTTTLEFMKRCRPATAAFYDYWDEKRGDRAMPARASATKSRNRCRGERLSSSNQRLNLPAK